MHAAHPAGRCQLNTVVGDLDGNVERILAAYDQAEAAGCDLAVFPELAITGYPPEDLLLKPAFVAPTARRSTRSPPAPGSCAAVVGFVDADRDLLQRGRGLRRRRGASASTTSGCCPTTRCSTSSATSRRARADCPLFEIAGVRVGVAICEDVWSPDGPDRRRRPPAAPS